jgi:hypothetical protein
LSEFAFSSDSPGRRDTDKVVEIDGVWRTLANLRGDPDPELDPTRPFASLKDALQYVRTAYRKPIKRVSPEEFPKPENL